LSVSIVNSKLEDWADSYSGEKFHAVLCDPPYNWNFMQKGWDKVSGDFSDVVGGWGNALKKVLYPGALVLMFAGPRTAHHVAYGMERSGYDVWDKLIWFYISGMPKGQDIGKLIDRAAGAERERVPATGGLANYSLMNDDGWAQVGQSAPTQPSSIASTSAAAPWCGYKTASLKPAYEEVLCFKLPSGKSYAEVALDTGAGALNIDGCRIGTEQGGWHGKASTGYGSFDSDGDPRPTTGRYPSNVLLDEASAALMDLEFGTKKRPVDTSRQATPATDNCFGEYGQRSTVGKAYGDDGGISRWFFSSKACTRERNKGVDGKNTHVAVKPLSVCKWLSTLLLPPNVVSERRILVPFSGSGSEVIGAMKAGWDSVTGVEMEPEYCSIAEQRIAYWSTHEN